MVTAVTFKRRLTPQSRHFGYLPRILWWSPGFKSPRTHWSMIRQEGHYWRFLSSETAFEQRLRASYVYVRTHIHIYIYVYTHIYICSPPPPRSTLRGSKAFALRTPSTYALERKTEREQERRREFITRKKDRENKQIRTCVPVLLNGRMA